MAWFKDLATRLTWASKIIADQHNPIIKLENGISLDIKNNRLILDGDVAIHVTGNFSISADGDVDIRSGKMFGKETGNILLNSDDIESYDDYEDLVSHELEDHTHE